MDLLLTSSNFRFGENKNTWKFPVFTKYKDTLFFFEANCAEWRIVSFQNIKFVIPNAKTSLKNISEYLQENIKYGQLKGIIIDNNSTMLL